MDKRKMRPITVVEIVLSYISIGWAYVLLTTPDLFNTGGSWHLISDVIVHEWMLGLIALLCAIVKIAGMLLSHKRLRWVGLMMSTIFWVVIATGFLISNGYVSFTTGFIAYSGIAVMSLWTSKEVMTNDRSN